MDSGEPELLSPLEADFFARLPQLIAVVGSAFPGAAGQSSRQRIFGGHQKQASARLEDPQHLLEARARIRQVLDDPATGNAVEAAIGKRQILHVSRDEFRPVTFQTLPGPMQHIGRQVAGDDADIVARLAKDVTENLPRPGADIEDALKTADVEPPGPQHQSHQGIVQRDHAAQPDCRSPWPVVKPPYGVSVLAGLGSTDAFEFDESAKRFAHLASG